MKRRLQDISNQDGFDESQSGKTSPEIRRRRVAMEKRRRDKINLYLNELSKLVPEAAEKTGSTKLEKAEVLEMTVDYVKKLTKERKGSSQNPRLDPETERKRGFMACLSHIKGYLEKQPFLPNSNEQTSPKPDYISYNSGSITSEQPKVTGHFDPGFDAGLFSQRKVFNKICSDFLKNSSLATPQPTIAEQPVYTSYAPSQQWTDLQDSATCFAVNRNTDFVYANNVDFGYGSFLSAINGP